MYKKNIKLAFFTSAATYSGLKLAEYTFKALEKICKQVKGKKEKLRFDRFDFDKCE